MSATRRFRKSDLLRPLTSSDDLHAWIERFIQITIPRRPVCPGHCAPFDYVRRAYFEPTTDLVIWAPRGGGKTRLAALATLLDLLHKPGCSVRILGGSLEQSLRLWEHLMPDIERLAARLIVKRARSARRITLSNGSSAAVLTQSERAVRGLRVQKLRCDETELFKPEIWEAAQLVTRSRESSDGPDVIRGSIEAISTFHSVHGLMSKIVERAARHGTPIIHWCLMEVLERCSSERDCKACALRDECRGAARTSCEGFVRIDDAIAMKHRVSRETWESEMLCRRPSVRGCVFPSFDASTHVREASPERDPITLAIDFGFANPFVCLWIIERSGATFVIDEYVQTQRTIADHLEQIHSRRWPPAKRIACDPAGSGRNDQTAESNTQFLRRVGYRVCSKRSLIVDGLELIRAALRPAAGAARLFIHPRCVRLIRAMQAYHYPDGGGELPLKDGTHDHLIDALRYYFVNRATGAVVTRAY